MAKIVKPKEKYHAMRIRGDNDRGELLLVGHGKRSLYLWTGHDNGPVLTFSGQATLRKLAKQILEIVGDEP